MSHELPGNRALNPVHWIDAGGTCIEGKGVYRVNSLGAVELFEVYLLDGTPVAPIPTGLLEGGCPLAFTDSWGHELVTATWFSPANLTSLAFTILTGTSNVTVNGISKLLSAGVQGHFGQEENLVQVKPANYVTFANSVGAQVYVTWQTRP